MNRVEHHYTSVNGDRCVAYGSYDACSDTYTISFVEQVGPCHWVLVPDEVYECSDPLRAASEFMWLRFDDATGRMTGFRIDHFQRANHKYHFTQSLERIFSL